MLGRRRPKSKVIKLPKPRFAGGAEDYPATLGSTKNKNQAQGCTKVHNRLISFSVTSLLRRALPPLPTPPHQSFVMCARPPSFIARLPSAAARLFTQPMFAAAVHAIWPYGGAASWLPRLLPREQCSAMRWLLCAGRRCPSVCAFFPPKK